MTRLAFLFALTAAGIWFAWSALGRPVAMPASPLEPGERLSCLSYAPFHGNQGPTTKHLIIPDSRIAADLARLSKFTSCVRTYAASNNEAKITELAGRYGLKVLQGVWIGRDDAANRREIGAALQLARNYPGTIESIIVGNEALLREEVTPAQLKAYLEDVRKDSGLPVSYADGWQWWLGAPEIAASVDFITIHINHYWEGEPTEAGNAVEHVRDVLRQVGAAFPGKKILVGEVGWPSAGRMRGGALPSRVNQALVLSDLAKAAKAEGWNVNFIEAFDQAWKLPLDGSWGLFEDGPSEPKFRWGEPVSNYPQWRTEAVLGIGAAFYVYLAAWFGGVAGNRSALSWKRSLAVAAIALVSGLVFGWGALQLPIVSPLLGDKLRAVVLFVLALIVPGIAAAAVARGSSLLSFSLALNPPSWRRADGATVLLAALSAASVAMAIHFALSLIFEWRGNTFPLAGLTAIVAALAATVVARPLALPRPGVAEIVAASLLCASAIYITVNEGIANWQALWFAALLVALSLTALLARPAPD